MITKFADCADVLLVTVTDVEIQTVLSSFNRQATDPSYSKGGINRYYDLGDVKGSRVQMAFCPEMGAGGPGGSQSTIDDAIRELNPNAVIMVGMAFGVDNQKQRIGDILVSTGIRCYDHQRVGSSEDGGYRLIIRGFRPNASPSLLSLFRAGAISFRETQIRTTNDNDIQFGILLSGEKLVDNFDYREQLKKFEPEAIGGEMEGAGLYAAASRRGKEWILVKAISDFADGQKHENKEENQYKAAYNAAQYVAHVLGHHELANVRPIISDENAGIKNKIDPGGRRAIQDQQIHLSKDMPKPEATNYVQYILSTYLSKTMTVFWCEFEEFSGEIMQENIFDSLLLDLKCEPSKHKGCLLSRCWGDTLVALFVTATDAFNFALNMRDKFLYYDWYSIGKECPPDIRIYVATGKMVDFYKTFYEKEHYKLFPIVQQCRGVIRTEPVMVFYWNQSQNDSPLLNCETFLKELPDQHDNGERYFLVYRSEDEWRLRPLYDEQYYRREKVLRRFSYLWLVLDQLPCGSWGRSIPIWMRNVWRNCPPYHPNSLMEEEGGFETTILSLDILCKIHGAEKFYNSFSRSAINGYLRKRQDAVGGIGPLGSERMGLAIQSKPRHTALALWFIAENLLQNGQNPNTIVEMFRKGILYLFSSQGNISDQFSQDSNPVLLYMSCWHLIRLIKENESVGCYLDSNKKNEIIKKWDKEIAKDLLSSAMQSSYEPIPPCRGPHKFHEVWPLTVPYGKFARMELYSFLSAAQFIHRDMSRELIDLFRNGVKELQKKYLDSWGDCTRYLPDKLHQPLPLRGIFPFYTDIELDGTSQCPDIGVTSMLLRLLRNREIISTLWPKDTPSYLDKIRFFLSEDLNSSFDKYLSNPELFSLTNASMLVNFIVHDDKRSLIEKTLAPVLLLDFTQMTSQLDIQSSNHVLSEKRIDSIINEQVIGVGDENVVQVASFSLSRHLLDYVRPGRYIEDKLCATGREKISKQTLKVYQNPSFVQKFSLIWKDRVNPAMIEPFLASLEQCTRILDIGCGIGQYAQEFEKRGHKVTILDGSKEMLNYATSKLKGNHGCYECNILCSEDRKRLLTKYGNHSFGAIWCSGTLAHVPKSGWTEVLKWFNDLLNENDSLFVNVMVDNPRIFAYDERFFVYVQDSNDFLEVLENSGFTVNQSLSSYISVNTYNEPYFRANWVNFFASKISDTSARRAEADAIAASVMTAHAYQRSVQQFVKIHSGNPKRGDIVNNLIDKLSGHLNKKIKYPVVLDAGCGPGDYLREMAQRNWPVYGIDISPGMVRYCKEENERSAKDYNIKVYIKDIEQLPKEWNEFFDAIISVTVFQHLRDNKAINVLRQLTSALKPGGVIYIDVQQGRTRGYDPDLRFIEGYMNKDDVFKRLQIDEIGLSIIHTEEWTLPAGNNTFRRPIEFKFLEIWLQKK